MKVTIVKDESKPRGITANETQSGEVYELLNADGSSRTTFVLAFRAIDTPYGCGRRFVNLTFGGEVNTNAEFLYLPVEAELVVKK